MKKRDILIPAVCICLYLMGCSQKVECNNGSVTGEVNKMERIDLNEREQAFFSAIFIDKESIESGFLEDWQLSLLNEFRAGEEYLGKKYPDSEIRIINYDTTTQTRDYDIFILTEEKHNDRFYEMHIEMSNNTYIITDNYYGCIIKEDSERMIKNVIDKAKIPCFNVKASFGGFLDDSYGSNIRFMDALSGVIDTDNLFLIYLDPQGLDHGSYKDNVQEIKKLMESQNIVGEFTIIFGDDDIKNDYRESFFIGE